MAQLTGILCYDKANSPPRICFYLGVYLASRRLYPHHNSKEGEHEMVEYNVISDREWERMPAPEAAKPPSEWEPVLDELEQGRIISLPFNDPKDRRSKYMAVARRAAGRGFKTQMRHTDNTMAIRKSEEPYTRPPAKPRQPRQRRAAAGTPPEPG